MSEIKHRMYKDVQADRIILRHQKQFDNLTRRLEVLLSEVREYEPEAEYYLSNDTLNLMVGPAHTGLGENHQENVALSRTIPGLDGGGW